MVPREKISAKVISQIALMESVVAGLPTSKAIAQFIQEGLQDVPGIHQAFHRGPDDPQGFCQDGESIERFPLESRGESYGCLEIHLTDEQAFEVYRPYITNLASMLGLIYAERHQRDLYLKYQNTLQEMVEERTSELARALEAKERIQGELNKALVNYRTIFETAEVGIWTMDFSMIWQELEELRTQGIQDLQAYVQENPTTAQKFFGFMKVLDANQATIRMFGFDSKEDLLENHPGSFLPQTFDAFAKAILAIWKKEALFRQEVEFRRKNGEIFTCLVSIGFPRRGQDYDRITSVTMDISQRIQTEKEKQALQEQLTQIQKMQAIGQLAGGVAHDFNNMLAGILGGVEILEFESDHLSEKGRSMLELVRSSASRSAELTRKLLLFSRKKPSEMKVFSPNKMLEEIVTLLERTFPKHHRIEFQRETEDCLIKGDLASIQNAIMNLCINASHAMDGAGTVLISSRVKNVDLDYCRNSSFELESGPFLEISVKDNGQGVPEEFRSKIFEPFFTTKKSGMGTGLGLSTVFAVVKQHGGEISLESKVGEGSLFRILIPCIQGKASQSTEKTRNQNTTYRILVVEDEELVRRATVQLLLKMNHQVEECDSAETAMDLLEKNSGNFDLLIMDQIMNGMSGKEARQRIQQKFPGIRVLIMSGFTGSEELHLENGFLAKPFTRQELQEAIHQSMNRPI